MGISISLSGHRIVSLFKVLILVMAHSTIGQTHSFVFACRGRLYLCLQLSSCYSCSRSFRNLIGQRIGSINVLTLAFCRVISGNNRFPCLRLS